MAARLAVRGQGGDGAAAAPAADSDRGASIIGATPSAAGSSPRPDRSLEQWLAFALAQDARCAPHPAPAALDGGGPPAAHRLLLSHLEALPLFSGADRPWHVRLGVSLYDEAAGCFFGATAHSDPVAYDMRRSKGRRGFHLAFDWSLYLHTRAALGGADSTSLGAGGAAPARLLAVVEVVLVERSEEGVALSEVSAGWCAVPLAPPGGPSCLPPSYSAAAAAAASAAASAGGRPGYASPPALPPKAPAVGISSSQPRRRGSLLASCLGCSAGATWSPDAAGAAGPPSPLRAGCLAARLGAGGALSVPVYAGSPRWLLVQREAPAGCPPPAQLLSDGVECRLHYQASARCFFEPCPEAAAWAPLAPPNFLLSSRDVVPGVQRLAPAAAGPRGGDGGAGSQAPTLRLLGASSQLRPPQLQPLHAVVLSGLRVHLPEGFAEVARQHAAALWRQAHGAAPGLPPPSPAPGAAAPAASAAAGGGISRKLLPLRELQRSLRLRVSVHNGRRFVGPPVLREAAALEPVAGRRGQHVLALAGDAPLAWLPADRCVALVLELLLEPGPPSLSDGQAGSDGGGGSETVLGWAAAMPFRWQGRSRLQLAVAAGAHQVCLRSGPGRWLRPVPVLDWRRLIESTNRPSPQAPTVSFVLAEALGQAVWPPPAAPVALRASLPPPAPAGTPPASRSPSRQPSRRQAQQAPSAAASEAETLVSMPAAGLQRQPLKAAACRTDGLGGGKLVAAPQSVEAWRIHALYDAPPLPVQQQQQQQRLPSVLTRPQQPQGEPSGGEEEAAALYAGSPTAKRSALQHLDFSRQSTPASAAAWRASVGQAAAAAVPAAEVATRHISLAAELDDPLATAEASLQLLAFEAAPGAYAGSGDGGPEGGVAGLPSSLHFTWRWFGGDPPAVTAPLRLVPAARQSSSSSSSGSFPSSGPSGGLFALEAAGGSAVPPPPERLQLMDVPSLQRAVAELASAGLPASAGASLVRQHRLRAARYLAGSQLQVDVWDSGSLLPLGTLRVPLRGLLRQGQGAAEALLRVPVGDAGHAILLQQPSDSGGGSLASLPLEPLRGSIVLRLTCAGSRLQLPGAAASSAGGACSWPASPMRHPSSSSGGGHPAAVVVQARPALEETEGPLLRELARQEGVPDSVGGERLRGEVVGRAAAKAQRLLAFQSSAGVGGSSGGAAGSGWSQGSGPGAAGGPGQLLGHLVEQRLAGEVEAARERCKRGAILERLQAELPSCVVLCAAPGDAAGFECLFINSGGDAAWFEVDCGGDGGGSGGRPQLSLVAGEREWQALAPLAGLAGLAAGGSGSGSGSALLAAPAPRFQLGPQERCLLRFRVQRSLADQEAPGASSSSSSAGLHWQDITVWRLAGGAAQLSPAQQLRLQTAAAAYRVAVHLLAAPAIDRTLRLYCPASAVGSSSTSSGAAPVHASIQLDHLPGCAGLHAACSSHSGCLAFATSDPGVGATLQADQQRLLLSSIPPPAGATRRLLLAACSSGSSSMVRSPLETWDVFLHSLPLVRLAAAAGSAAHATWLLPPAPEVDSGAAAGQASALRCHWQSAQLQHGELQASVAGGGGGSGGQLALRFAPAAVARRQLLLSVVAAPPQPSQGARLQRPRQAALLLLDLDSSATRVTRSFQVSLPRGQTVSKKVRYTSPHPGARRFAVRGLGAPDGLLRVAPAAAAGFELGGGEGAPIKLTFDATACTACGRHELLAVVESCGCDGADSVRGSGSGDAPDGASGGDGRRTEEVFRVLLTVT